MAWSVVFGVAGALLTGLVVGLWAAIVGAPPEVAGGVASGIGAVIGVSAFATTLCIRYARRLTLRPAMGFRGR